MAREINLVGDPLRRALKRHRCPLARAPCLNRSSVITSYILLSALFLFLFSEALRDVMQKEMKFDDQMSGDVGAVSIRYLLPRGVFS
jgi:hypothetical protein